MIRISNLRIGLEGLLQGGEETITGGISKREREAIERKVRKRLPVSKEEAFELTVEKKSVDARKKGGICLIYTVSIRGLKEEGLKKKVKDKDVGFYPDAGEGVLPGGGESMVPPYRGSDAFPRPIVVGMGPAGLFCAHRLARAGLRPLLIERGKDVDARVREVERFWETNALCGDTNVQFGEGGAGTFSDGKLNTMVKDASGRKREVLSLFLRHGAPPEIAYLAKPHIGTDRLRKVVKSLREEILALGGEVRFETRWEGLEQKEGKVTGCVVKKAAAPDAPAEHLPCDALVLAIGHSARDGFATLYEAGLEMRGKAFAVGVRLEHLQEWLNDAQYGGLWNRLPPAEYKLAWQTGSGRGVYSFCMCPGGYVVNASTEQDGLAINGMSLYNRGGSNANAAIVVTVTPEDFAREVGEGVPEALRGVEFQRRYERLAFKAAAGRIPVQRLEDFVNDKESRGFGSVRPQTKGDFGLANVRACLPSYVAEAIVEGIGAFDKSLKGFGDGDAVVSGVETRTSSPVRIERDESLQSNVRGLYPCGEGAGYAGGIVSAAMDGLKVAEAVLGGVGTVGRKGTRWGKGKA